MITNTIIAISVFNLSLAKITYYLHLFGKEKLEGVTIVGILPLNMNMLLLQ